MAERIMTASAAGRSYATQALDGIIVRRAKALAAAPRAKTTARAALRGTFITVASPFRE